MHGLTNLKTCCMCSNNMSSKTEQGSNSGRADIINAKLIRFKATTNTWHILNKITICVTCDVVQNSPRLFTLWPSSLQWFRASSFARFLDHTQRCTTVGRSSGRGISSFPRPLPDNTQHSQQTYMSPVEFFTLKWSELRWSSRGQKYHKH